MVSNSGRLVLTFNGEIYNHLEIRKELQNSNLNINWKSKTDTETLLEALDLWESKNFKKNCWYVCICDLGQKKSSFNFS